MTSKEIRQSFLDFFKGKEHAIVPSAPVVPHGDPTLLFTNAGMNQFKDVFLGQGKRDFNRAADTQKCIRVSGKHNDLEEVGVDTYHHTFFEMLGNWSFGDYYKKEAIDWCWELLTKVWNLPADRLYATVFETDDEAYELWKKYLPESQIQRHGAKDNFWEMGETGPCGPCSEVHYDRTKDKSGAKLVNMDSPEVIEIWNLVFIQYNRKAGGVLEDLSATHVDTGMGFERICAVLQGKDSNYDTDVFMPILKKIEELSGKKYNPELTDKTGIAMRVIADHVRTLSFAIADGAMPGNEGRSYVLRRILRRGCRFARNLGFREPMMFKLVPTLIEVMGEQFPEIGKQQTTIEKIIKGEEESFLQTLDRGIEKFEEMTKDLKDNTILGADAFMLYDTFGFPLDLTELMAREAGYKVDIEGFNKNMQEQKERSRAARKVNSQEAEIPEVDEVSEFIGYNTIETEAKILWVEDNKVVLDKTPFYAESGGQVSDYGTLTIAANQYDVIDVKKVGDAIIHICDRDVEQLIGGSALAKVDETRRQSIKRNHSATHILHEALRTVLGTHVQQAGSSVAPDYLRFDFNHFEKVTDEQIEQIERLANEKILEAHSVKVEEKSIEDAQKNDKIKMFFGDKYGSTVRVVTMDPAYSMELCGGTHVSNTAEIGLVKITSESSIAAGVRRLEAVTGKGVEEFIAGQKAKLKEKDVTIADLQHKIKQMEKEISDLKVQGMASLVPDMIAAAELVGEIRVVAKEVEAEDMDQLRDLGEELRNSFGKQGIGLLARIDGDKVQLVCVATDDLVKSHPAGKLVGAAAKALGGGGGGKPHMATAGGRDVSKLPELLASFAEMVKGM